MDLPSPGAEEEHHNAGQMINAGVGEEYLTSLVLHQGKAWFLSVQIFLAVLRGTVEYRDL